MHIAKPMPNGVTVAQLILVQFVEVRILIGQPFSPFSLRNFPSAKIFFDPGVSVFVAGLHGIRNPAERLLSFVPFCLILFLKKRFQKKIVLFQNLLLQEPDRGIYCH